MRIFSLLLVSLYVVLNNPINAQHELDTVYVLSSQIPMKISETGRSVSVIRSDEIEKISANSIDELLQTVTGLEIQSRGGFGVQADILMRGSTFTQVLVLIDGMKLNDPLTAHFNGNIAVSKSEIERIEVLRGSAAAMYGADAVGGIINIISKTFAGSEREDSTEAGLSYGSNKYIEAEHGLYRKKDRISYSTAISIKRSDGELFEEQFVDTTTRLESYRNYFDIKTLGFGMAYLFDDGLRLSARTSYDYRDFDARYFYTSSSLDKSVETVSNLSNHIQLKKLSGRNSTDINLAFKHNTDKFVFSPDFPSTNQHVSQFLNFTANHFIMLSEELRFKTGLQLDRRSIESNDRGDHNDLHVGVYVMGAFNKDSMNANLSVRSDYDDNYNLEFCPQLNLSYVLDKVVLRASVGRSIRAADYTERFVSNNLVDLSPGRSLGNPDLRAESSWSYEMGADIKLSGSLSFNTTLYARRSSDLIDYVLTNEQDIDVISEQGSLQANADYYFARNISKVFTKGLEFGANFNRKLGEDIHLSWNASYAYNKSSNDENVVSVYISSHANHLLSSNIVLEFENLLFSLNTLYKKRDGRLASAIDSELEDDYILWNSKLAYDLNSDLSIYVQVQNLFDTEYQNILGARMPGRWLISGIKTRF